MDQNPPRDLSSFAVVAALAQELGLDAAVLAHSFNLGELYRARGTSFFRDGRSPSCGVCNSVVPCGHEQFGIAIHVLEEPGSHDARFHLPLCSEAPRSSRDATVAMHSFCATDAHPSCCAPSVPQVEDLTSILKLASEWGAKELINIPTDSYGLKLALPGEQALLVGSGYASVLDYCRRLKAANYKSLEASDWLEVVATQVERYAAAVSSYGRPADGHDATAAALRDLGREVLPDQRSILNTLPAFTLTDGLTGLNNWEEWRSQRRRVESDLPCSGMTFSGAGRLLVVERSNADVMDKVRLLFTDMERAGWPTASTTDGFAAAVPEVVAQRMSILLSETCKTDDFGTSVVADAGASSHAVHTGGRRDGVRAALQLLGTGKPAQEAAELGSLLSGDR